MFLDETTSSKQKQQQQQRSTKKQQQSQRCYQELMSQKSCALSHKTRASSIERVRDVVKSSMSRLMGVSCALDAKSKLSANQIRQHPFSRSLEEKARAGNRNVKGRLQAGKLLQRSLSVQQQQQQQQQQLQGSGRSASLRQSAQRCCNSITNNRFLCSQLRGSSSSRAWLTRTPWALLMAILLSIVCVTKSLPILDPATLDGQNLAIVESEEFKYPLSDADILEFIQAKQPAYQQVSEEQLPQAAVSAFRSAQEAELEEALEADNSSAELDRQLEQQGDQSFWVQRRRLNRDRALEPASWLRDQPMRRASSAALQGERQENENSFGNNSENEPQSELEGANNAQQQIFEEIKIRLKDAKGNIRDQGSLFLARQPDGSELRVASIQHPGAFRGVANMEEERESSAIKRRSASDDDDDVEVEVEEPVEEEQEDESAEESRLLTPSLMKRAPKHMAKFLDEQQQYQLFESLPSSMGDQNVVPGVGSSELDEQEILSAAANSARSLSQNRLAMIATRLKSYLEDMIQIPRGSILSLYPLNSNTILIRLDVDMLNRSQLIDMVRNYDFARGYISKSWPQDSKRNPVSLLRAILRAWVATNSESINEVLDRFEEFSGQLEANSASWPDRVKVSRGELAQARLAEPRALFMEGLASELEESGAGGEPEEASLEELSRLYALAERRPSFGRAESSSLPQPSNRFQPPAYKLAAAPLIPASDYLSALYAASSGAFAGVQSNLNPAVLVPPVSFAGQQQQPSGSSLAAAKLRSKQLAEEDSSSAWKARDWIAQGPHLVQLLGLLAVVTGTCVAVKLVMRSSDKQLLRRQFARLGTQTSSSFKSIWSSQSTISGELACNANQEAALQKANLENRGQLEKGAFGEKQKDDEEANKSKSLDVLTQRLVNLLKKSSKQQYGCRKKSKAWSKKKNNYIETDPSSTDKLEDDFQEADDEDRTLDKKTANCDCGHPENHSYELEEDEDDEQTSGHFRSSRSYIKSLIDVLSNARSHMPSVGVPSFKRHQQRLGDDCLVATEEEEEEDDELDLDSVGKSKRKLELEEAGVSVSQMDISAAHLILAYMERHLEDKERLRREWDELNALSLGASSSSSSSSSKTPLPSAKSRPSWAMETGSNGLKMRQLMLQRLAKVALSEENRLKNRSLLVVPFDRNRVRLFNGTIQAGSLSPSSSSGLSARCKPPQAADQAPKGAPKTRQLGKQSDYINASYIHDDEPRKPTHIIAQGPLEHTVGQFWQMIWEQGISVIVMLTRLNENGLRTCHCYWPTNAAVVQVASGSAPPDAAAGCAQEQLAGKSSPPAAPTGVKAAPASSSSSSNANGRRGSVTSVFDASAVRQPLATLPACENGHPILANGDLTNNMLVFDVACGEQSSLEEQEEEESKKEEEGEEGESKRITSGSSSSELVKKGAARSRPIRFEIHLVSEHVSSNDYLVRNMYIINRSSGETRTITQFHYLAWPVNGVPSNPKSLLSFRRKVHKSYRDLKSPILVHCSEGAGRSGTYTLIDIILERIKNGAKEIDPRATLEHLRDQRVALCANQSQFEFVLVALAEEIQTILNALPR